MLPRFPLPSARGVLAIAAFFAVTLTGMGIGIGFGLSALLGIAAMAAIYFRVRVSRPAAPARPARPQRPPAAPPTQQLAIGNSVITTRDVGGGFLGGEVIHAGHRGTIVGFGWGGAVNVDFVIHGAMGVRQVRIQLNPDDIRRSW